MPDYERSFAAPRTFPDEYIEAWAEVYLANAYLRRRCGVLFETFLLNPLEILAEHALPVGTVSPQGGPRSRCGLLPEQLDVRQRADLESALQEMEERVIAALVAECRCVNGAWIMKLRHHAWATRRPARRKLMEM